MKTSIYISIAAVLICTLQVAAQVGVGTTTPNSTLDIRGSISAGYRAFTASTAAATTDNILLFTGTAATTLTLPDATSCTLATAAGTNFYEILSDGVS